MIRLSVIVPFYNVEPYIKQCVRSLYDQDIPLSEYEVICVDDCSPDCSRAIVKQLQREYSNLHLICHERNKKLGGARNTGLKAAKGEYIWFVDSDDYVVPNVMGRLLREAEENELEILHFDYVVRQGEKAIQTTIPYEDEAMLDGESFVCDERYAHWFVRCPVAWDKLHQRKFLLENNLFYAEDVMYEDTDLSLYMYTLTKRVKHVNMVAYNYRQNPEATTQRKRTAEMMRYTILQQKRCMRAMELAKTEAYRDLVNTYVHSQLVVLRREIRGLEYTEKVKYGRLMHHTCLHPLKSMCNWRTWLAIKYGITWFVK